MLLQRTLTAKLAITFPAHIIGVMSSGDFVDLIDKMLLQGTLTDKTSIAVATTELAGVQIRTAMLVQRVRVDKETITITAIAVAC